MSRTNLLRIAFALLGIILLVAPFFLRTTVWGYHRRPYATGQVPLASIAATPVPTATAIPLADESMLLKTDLRPGPVVVDLAHGNRINRNRFEPLAAALARRGVGVRFWLSEVDVLSVTNYLDYPDQSAELRPLLNDASALVVVSPFFLWSPEEITLVEQFVADGGHLLLISDPDVIGDLAQDINNLAEPFGVVFNDDYLYDQGQNDGNFTYVYVGDYQDQAVRLAERRIAFYGARSISGEVTPQLRTTNTTLSSVRSGITNFTMLALGGLETRGTKGRVLAMSDFDVLTAPFVERHDNSYLLEFVAGFLAAANRHNTVTDFPGYLGKQVSLIFGNATAVDAQILMEGARLQRALELSGRELNLAGSTLLTQTLAAGATAPEFDLITLADYQVLDDAGLLKQIGFTRIEVTAEPSEEAAAEPLATPAATADAAPTATATPLPGATVLPSEPGLPDVIPDDTLPDDIVPDDVIPDDVPDVVPPGPTPTEPVTVTVPITAAALATATVEPGMLDITATVTPTETAAATPTLTATPTPTPTPTPVPTVYLQKHDGLRLLARETVIIAQLQLAGQHRMVAVLGHDNEGIRSGVDRLLSGDYTGCLTGPDLVVCSFEGSPEPTPTPVSDQAVAPTAAAPLPTEEATAVPQPEIEPTAPPARQIGSILVVDDNDSAGTEETSEADTYLQALTQLGHTPTLWDVATQGVPSLEELNKYQWVIWSSGGYENGGPTLGDLDPLLGYINTGGWLTISSRRPFFGMGTEDPSVIADIEITDAIPALVSGLPSGVIELPNGLPPVVPLETNGSEEGPQIAFRRGPDSGSAGAPLLFLVTDEGEPESSGAKLMILGMAIHWLPEDYDQQLVENMANVMLAGG